jgi:hypothetical protein
MKNDNKKILAEIKRFKELSNIKESSVNEDLIDDLQSLGSAGIDAIKNSDFVKTIKSVVSNDENSPIKDSGIIQKIKDMFKGITSDEDIKDIELGHISDKGQKLLDNKLFQDKLDEISSAIHIDKKYIIKLMNHESGLDPKITNSIGCVGLIQFCPSGGSSKIINGKSYSLEDLRNDLGLQMDAIKEFWVKGYENGKIKSPEDLYIYNFFPVAAGKPDDFVLQSSGLSARTVANANPVFNRVLGKDRSTPLTVGGLKDYYQQTGMV